MKTKEFAIVNFAENIFAICYDLIYWLEAVVHIISEGKTETTFDEIIDEMIANAWYSAREFHIHLSGMQADGLVWDGLERAILQLTQISDLPANASKVEIKNAIHGHKNELKKAKGQLTNMVSYRALAGFFARSKEAGYVFVDSQVKKSGSI